MAPAVRVLVVAPKRMEREGLSLALRWGGDVDVLEAVASTEEAVQLCRDLTPDVLVVDVGSSVPEESGTVSELRRDYPEGRILAVTSSGKKARAVEGAAAAVFPKTRPSRELVGLIHAVARPRSRLAAGKPLETGAERTPGDRLTVRELEVLHLLARGRSTFEIARRLEISPHTVKQHVRSILAKLEAGSRVEAVGRAVRLGLAEPVKGNAGDEG